MWSFYKENIMTDRPSAIYFNSKGINALEVYESRDSYFTKVNVKGIDSCSVTYEKCSEILKLEEPNLKEINARLYHRLVIACRIFEDDYKHQVVSVIGQL